jgi:dTDP-4-dehydrorhamnose 3,5-epimerase
MDFSTTAIPGLIEFTPTLHHDDRGFFSRTFDAETARRAGVDPGAFVQDSQSRSAYAVVRGLHLRLGEGEGKIVRCAHGRMFDVVVDLRPASPAYRTWLSFILDGDVQNSVFIPPGCAHGFQALTETVDTAYRINRTHDPSEDLTIAHDDADLAIPWPLPVGAMSAADRAALPLADVADQLRRVEARA